jgi:hypothetical protein
VLKYLEVNKSEGGAMNWLDLEKRVYEAAKSAFTSLLNSHPGEQFYACALYTDNSAMTICPSANSMRGLETKVNQEEEEDRSEEAIQYYKWASSEWAYEAWGSERFKDVCKSLRESSERNNIEKFQSQVLHTMTNALLMLKNEGFFLSFGIRQAPILFVTITDDDRAEDVENQSAKILNGEKEFNEFINRYNSAE